MSGFNEQEAGARFVGKGLAGFLQKPFTPEELRERLVAFGKPSAQPT
jgi:CheY-like chemotaxis protein